MRYVSTRALSPAVGFTEALLQGLAPDGGLYVPEVWPRMAGEALLALDAPPTALFTAQNLITIGAVGALQRSGRARSIALVGFDDVDLSDAVDPGLTVVAQDPVALGRVAAALLFDRIDGNRGPARLVTEPTRLIVRGSGEIRPPLAG